MTGVLVVVVGAVMTTTTMMMMCNIFVDRLLTFK
jgi:hypothetical protein